MSDPVKNWNCQLSGTEDLTVGSLFALGCSGESTPFKKESLRIEGPNADLYILKILEIRTADDRHIDAVVTSYTPGESKSGTLFLTDGTSKVGLLGTDFQVKSVIKQGEQVEPYPSFGPWGLNFPLWFWILLVVVVFTPAILLWRWSKKRRQVAKLFEEMERHKTARPPFDEFHRELRLIERKHGVEPQKPEEFLQELDKAFRLYLVRELVVPAFDWSDSEILREIKRRHRFVFDESEKLLRKGLRELRKAASTKATQQDCQQLRAMVLETTEEVFKAIDKNKKRRVSL